MMFLLEISSSCKDTGSLGQLNVLFQWLNFQTKYIMQKLAFVMRLANRISEIESILQISEHTLITNLEAFLLLNFIFI